MKILSLDGGGIKGIIPALILEKLEKETQKPICELFDLIAGTSTGGLIALALSVDNGKGKPKFSAAEVVELYTKNGASIFDRSRWHRIKSGGNLTDEKYQKDKFKELLEDYFGSNTLRETLTEVLITSYETERRIPWLFKSKKAKDLKKKDKNFKLTDVALATSAAPTYFEAHKLELGADDYLSLIDGGVYANNPALCAYVDAKSMFGAKDGEIQLVSLGTGQHTRKLMFDDIKDWGLIKWAQPVLSCVFDGVSDTVDYQLSKILPSKNYFRFQTELHEGNDDMDDVSAENLRSLRLEAEKILRENKSSFDRMIREVCS